MTIPTFFMISQMRPNIRPMLKRQTTPIRSSNGAVGSHPKQIPQLEMLASTKKDMEKEFGYQRYSALKTPASVQLDRYIFCMWVVEADSFFNLESCPSISSARRLPTRCQ